MSKNHGLALVVLIFCVSQANATLIDYDDRTAFEAATSLLETETFSSFLADVNLGGGAVVALGGGDFTVTGPAVGIARIETGGGSNSLGDGPYIQGIGAGGSSMTFTFGAPITAFGVDLNGINDGIVRTQVLVDGTLFGLPVVGGSTVDSFFGVTASPDMAFTTVEFDLLAGEDAGLDNISYGAAAVPEPTTLLLMGLGLAGLGFARRRRLNA